MAYYYILVDKYDIYYPGGGKEKYEYRAIIGLRKNDGTLHGALYFHKDSDTMPKQDTRNPATPYIYCHYPAEDFANIVDILRNELPIYFTWVGSETEGQGAVTTSLEPIGEEEGSS